MDDEFLNVIRQLLMITFNIENKFKKVYDKNGIVISIRTKENGHNEPHCHVTYRDKEISISLIDFKVLSNKNMKKHEIIGVTKAAMAIKEELRSEWEKYHGTIEL